MDPLPPTPFQSGWWSFGLGTARPCDTSTYCLFPYESLPPLPEPEPTLSWLDPLDADLDREMEIYRNPPDVRGQLGTISADAQRLGLVLPDAFMRLMSSPDLQDRIPSCTACTFGLSDRIIPCPSADGAFLIPFLSDRQGCLEWCLYLTRTGEQCVVAMPGNVAAFLIYGKARYEATYKAIYGEAYEDVDDAAFVRETRVCAPSFVLFIYRFWLENLIWYKPTGDDGTPLADAKRRYLEHYQQ